MSDPLDSQLGGVAAIAVGGSAGGVEALSLLLPALPAALRPPVFVVLHQPRERPSLLASIFAIKCATAVREAEDKLPIAGGTVYFAPPDYHLLVDVGPQLALSVDELVNFSRPSVDVLFESAVEIYGGHLLGIVLTGANADGAAGLRAIAHAGGLAVVQQPDSAYASAMPASALAATPNAAVLSLAEIADLLRHPALSAPPSPEIGS